MAHAALIIINPSRACFAYSHSLGPGLHTLLRSDHSGLLSLSHTRGARQLGEGDVTKITDGVGVDMFFGFNFFIFYLVFFMINEESKLINLELTAKHNKRWRF